MRTGGAGKGSAPLQLYLDRGIPDTEGNVALVFSVEQKEGKRRIAMLDRKTYRLMKRKYGDDASWAVWCPQTDKKAPKSNMGNMAWAKDEEKLCSELNPNFVFVGLNKSKRPKEKSEDENSNAKIPWKNFHSGYSRGNSYKLRYALKDTPFWGAYMTDIIKEIPDKDSNKVVQAIKTNSKKLVPKLTKVTIERNRKKFEAELSLLGGNPVLVAFGNDAYKFIKPLEGKYKIEKLPHYSSRDNIPKEEYREIVLETLKPYGKESKK